jgi:hypothetical protein
MAYRDEFDNGGGASEAGPVRPAASTNPAYDQNVFNQGVSDLYQKYYWRDPTQQELEAHRGNPNGLQGVESMLAATPNQSQVQKPAAQPAAQNQGGGSATGSPVTANGQIPPQSGVNSGARQVQSVDLSSVPAYKAATFQNTYKPSVMPDAYKADTLSQFAAPDQSGVNGQQNALLSAIFANPDTMNPQVVAQLKEKQKEEALLMAQQAGQQLSSGAAARNMVGSGATSAGLRNIDMDTINRILSGNRGVDITAAQTNRGDELNALNAGEQVAQGQLGRATQGYGTQLAGQTAQAGLNKDAVASALQRAIAGEQSNQFGSQFGLSVGKANADENYRANQDAVQRLMAQFGINTGVAQNAQQNYALDLDTQKFLENQRQFNNTLGFNYNNLDQNGQLALVQAILGR